jgi:alkylation response protein AidB-like acyl-CoA dehydrogenase
MTTATETADLVEAAKAFAPQIEACREESERERSLPAPLVRAMAEAGLFRVWVPKALGGLETDLETNLRVIEEVSKADGAAGWNTMIAATGGMFAAYLPPAAGKEIYGDPFGVVAGALAPSGRAVPEDGGFRLSGRWKLASGCQHAAWMGGGSFIFDGATPRLDANGIPDLHLFFLPQRECEIIDTWYAGGLRGTGSHDFALADAFIPAERTFSLVSGKPYYDGPLYRASIISVFGLPVVAVSLGIARTAIDTFLELAAGKTPTLTATLLRDRSSVQAKVAEAEALLRSARAFLYETAGAAWETMLRGDPLSEEQETLNRLACVHTARACADAVDIVYTLGGATSVYTTSKLERCFRDVHVVTQHITASFQWYERAGKFFLGMGLQRFG